MRQVIVYQANTTGNGTSLNFVCWLAVPQTLQLQYANSGFKSAIPNYDASICSWGITPTELTALQNGSVVEKVHNEHVIPGVTQVQLGAFIQGVYANELAALTNSVPSKSYTGAYWDGTTWSNLPA